MQIVPLGDSAMLLRLSETQEDDATTDELLAAARALEAAAIPGLIEVAPAYASLAVFYDPAAVAAHASHGLPFAVLAQQITKAVQSGGRGRANVSARLVEIPVCYGGIFGPDLEHVAEQTGTASDEVARRHAGAAYRVSCIGFTPGFPYLSGLPVALATPRRENPRTQVPAGSVGIGGKQSGIYPTPSPGGWNLIGRTPIQLFDPHRANPSFLQAGDAVRFRAITPAEFESWPAL